MAPLDFKQFVYDLASLWAHDEVEIFKCQPHVIQESESYLVRMSLFQWARFYWESDEKLGIKAEHSMWLKMACIKDGWKYRLFAKQARKEPLQISELLKEYDRQEILFRRFNPISDDYIPVVQSPRKRIMYSSGYDRTPWKTRDQRNKNNPILYRSFEGVLRTPLPRYHPDAGGIMFGRGFDVTPSDDGIEWEELT